MGKTSSDIGILDKLQPLVLAVFAECVARWPMCVYVYGEIFGGCYPHPAVAVDSSVSAVQTGIYYSPHIEFSAFDLATSTVVMPPGQRAFVPYADAMSVFAAARLPHQEPLFIGKYEQVQNYDIRFTTRVPERLGLPPLTDRTNYAEGVVIKPYRVAYVQGEKGLVRPIFKRKLPEFDERTEYHQAQKWNDDSDGDGDTDAAAAGAPRYDLVEGMLLEVDAMAVPARLHAAISKVGPVCGRDDVPRLRELAALLLEDFTDELREGYGEGWDTLSEEQRERLTEHMKRAATRMISAHLKQLQLQQEQRPA